MAPAHLAMSFPFSDAVIIVILSLVGSCIATGATSYLAIRISLTEIRSKLENHADDIVELKQSKSDQWRKINENGERLSHLQGVVEAIGPKGKAHHA